MSVYAGDYAELYDLFYADKPYAAEVDVVDDLLLEYGDGAARRLLDVACGTGRHATEFAARGWDVTGIDQSIDMLRRAQVRASPGNPTFVAQDMRRIDMGNEAFDAVVCLFDSIGYAVTNDAIGQTLGGIRRALRPGGLFAVEFWHAPPMLRAHDPVRERYWETATGKVERTSITHLDVAAGTARVDYEVRRIGHDGELLQTWRESHENRYFLIPEMDLLLGAADLEPLCWVAGFDRAARIDEETWHILAVARAGRSDG
jgi:SAM-dependent methyltransferase